MGNHFQEQQGEVEGAFLGLSPREKRSGRFLQKDERESLSNFRERTNPGEKKTGEKDNEKEISLERNPCLWHSGEGLRRGGFRGTGVIVYYGRDVLEK